MRLFPFLLPLMLVFGASAQVKPLHQRVNPFIGTGGHGHTFPGPTRPFGAVQLSPDTRLSGWDGCGGYHYSDSVIYGFSHTHLSGTGCSDYGDILLMPTTKADRANNYQFASRFSHKTEKAHAGYYSVFLEDPKVTAELTTTLHGGVHRYSFPNNAPKFLVLDLKHRDELLDSYFEQVDLSTIRGYRFSKAWAGDQRVYFEMQFSEQIEEILYEPKPGGSFTSAIDTRKAYQMIIRFKKKANASNVLMVRCALSQVDEAGARLNLSTEMPHWDFNRYVTDCEKAWDNELGKIKHNGKVPDAGYAKRRAISSNEDIIFYTALYHCMIHPSLASDVDGRYRGRDNMIHSTDKKFDYYTVFSLWDTYRGLHPLLTWIDQKRTADFMQTFVRQYEEGGRLPIWELSSNETNCMIGYHVVSVIWDAYKRGIRGFDAEKAYEAMTKIATHYSDYTGSGLNLTLKPEAYKRAADAEALESYNRYGYVRTDDAHESVSKTLEYAYNDWCIAQMAKALGKDSDAAYYNRRSYSWMNVYDPTTGFMRARKNGALYEPFSPYTVDNNFTEANSWQYSFYVPHHLANLIQLSGGEAAFEKKLDALFAAKTQTEGREQADITGLIGQYAHGNEPSHHIVFLYDALGKPEKSRALREKIAREFYTNAPDGLIGNEDCGQMSAWYVLNALGWYPICPGSENQLRNERIVHPTGAYVWPRFDSVRVYSDVFLSANLVAPSPTQVAQGKRTAYWLPDNLKHDSHIVLTSQYGKAGLNSSAPADKVTMACNPYIVSGKALFTDSLMVAMGIAQPEAAIFYTINGEQEKQYAEPISVNQNTTIQFYSRYKNQVSPTQTATFTRLRTDRSITLMNEYNRSYHAGGAQGMLDGVYGKLNWRAGDWQGYQGQDVTMVMRLEKPQTLKRVAGHFLEDQNAWIFYPKAVQYYSSTDSVTWTLLEEVPSTHASQNLTVSTARFETKQLPTTPIRYIKMVVRNFGAMPDWHEGRGNPTFFFIDEFEAE
ncbi:MAG: GH92 family glycosyl hydrolase [Chitinophagaceae bacterium]